MAQADLEEDLESGGGFARFLFFVTPILFTVVLLAVLLTLFNMNFRATMIDIGNKTSAVTSRLLMNNMTVRKGPAPSTNIVNPN